MWGEAIHGILIPFWGTTLGAACVLFMKDKINDVLQKALTAFAAGIMIAASIWSLLIPAIEQSDSMGRWSFVPALTGLWIGVLFMLILEKIMPLFHLNSDNPGGIRSRKKNTMMILAVTLHNIPEGMAVGSVFAGRMAGSDAVTMAGALALSIGIAIQNFPEGAIVSMPLKTEGMKKLPAFMYGVISGVMELLAAFITVVTAGRIVPVLPYLLSFAAGAMIYVVVGELIPGTAEKNNSKKKCPYLGPVLFSVGFTVMMALDVALG